MVLLLQLFSEKLYFFKYKYSFFKYNCKNNKASTLPLIIYNLQSNFRTINYVASCIAKEFDYSDYMIFDKEKPDGQFKKTANNYKLLQFLPNFQFTPIEKGITTTIEWFVKNYNLCRK